jgi:hypothetical protein
MSACACVAIGVEGFATQVMAEINRLRDTLPRPLVLLEMTQPPPAPVARPPAAATATVAAAVTAITDISADDVESVAFDVLATVQSNGAPAAEQALLAWLGAIHGVHHVEVMATAPCPLPILGLRLEQLTATDSATTTLALFRHTGVVCFPGATRAVDLEWLDAACTGRIAVLEAALVAEKGVDLSKEEFTLREVSTRGVRRFDLLLSAASFPSVHAWAREGPWMSLVQALVGASPVLDVSVIYSRPGAEDQQWHADGGHRDKVAGWDGTGQSDPYAVCVFVPLIDLRPELGATEFWPGSHKFDQLLGFGPVRWTAPPPFLAEMLLFIFGVRVACLFFFLYFFYFFFLTRLGGAALALHYLGHGAGWRCSCIRLPTLAPGPCQYISCN